MLTDAQGILLFMLRLIATIAFFVLTCSLIQGEELKIFDGSKRVILYQTSSHAGQKQLQELLRMVPGGEAFEVMKMPYPWAKTPEKIRQFPIIISRYGDGFNRQFKTYNFEGPISPEKHAEGLSSFG